MVGYFSVSIIHPTLTSMDDMILTCICDLFAYIYMRIIHGAPWFTFSSTGLLQSLQRILTWYRNLSKKPNMWQSPMHVVTTHSVVSFESDCSCSAPLILFNHCHGWFIAQSATKTISGSKTICQTTLKKCDFLFKATSQQARRNWDSFFCLTHQCKLEETGI